MSRMLNLAEGLLGMGRTRHQLGRLRDAFAILSRLSRFRDLPKDIAEETQARLGEIHLQRKNYARAQRHLAIAIKHDPDNTRYHLLLARALREQDDSQWDQSAEQYRKGLDNDPENVECLTELGLLCIRMGKPDEGLNHLRRAVELKPSDAEILGKLVKGLRLAGRAEEARGEIRGAMFRNPRDRRIQQLWSSFQFRMLRREQRHRLNQGQPTPCTGPILLPFVRSTSEETPVRPETTETRATIPLRSVAWMDRRNAR